MKLFLFDDAVSDSKVAVNPDLVRFLRPAGSAGDKTLIVFAEKETLTVNGSIDEVMSHLKT